MPKKELLKRQFFFDFCNFSNCKEFDVIALIFDTNLKKELGI